jgi:hypothetical protein
MKKLPHKYSNPIDNILYDLADRISPFFYKTGHTPNVITTYSFIFGLASVYYLSKGNIIYFSWLFAISYFFDCCDGFYARKYKMTSKFGDLYDHYTDIAIGFMILYLVFKKYNKNITPQLILLFIIFTVMLMVYTGCQQKIYNPNLNTSESLDACKQLCGDPRKIKWVRYFGYGTYMSFLIISINYLHCKTIK